MQEHQRKHVNSGVGSTCFTLGYDHRVFNGIEHFDIGGKVMEDRDSSWEASNRTERAEDALRDLVLSLEYLVTLPVHQVNKRDEVMDTAWFSDVQVARAVC